MKKITFLLLLSFSMFLLGQTITNKTFDSNTDGWAANPTGSATVSHDATEGVAALGSLKLVATAPNDRAQTSPNSVPISGAGDYTLTFKVKGVAGKKVQGTSFQTGNIKTGAQLTLTGGWDTYTETFTGINATNMNIRIVAVDTGTYYVDDVTWTYQIPPGNTVLTTSVVGAGTFTKNPDKPSYLPTDVVALTATPTTHWVFKDWTGDLTGTTNPSNITMDSNKNVTANFEVAPGFNYAFLYDTDGDLEGWTTDPQLAVTSHTGGFVTLTPTANQFARFNLLNFPIPAANYNKLTIKLQNNSATTNQLGIVVGSETKTISMSTSDTGIQTYEIPMATFTTWTGDVNSLKVRFADAANTNVGKPSDNGSIIIDSIVFTYDPALSVNQTEKVNNTVVYPNPTKSLLNIKTGLNINKVEIYNVNGQKVMQVENNNLNQIDVNKLSSGMYLINLFQDNVLISTNKFIKK